MVCLEYYDWTVRFTFRRWAANLAASSRALANTIHTNLTMVFGVVWGLRTGLGYFGLHEWLHGTGRNYFCCEFPRLTNEAVYRQSSTHCRASRKIEIHRGALAVVIQSNSLLPIYAAADLVDWFGGHRALLGHYDFDHSSQTNAGRSNKRIT